MDNVSSTSGLIEGVDFEYCLFGKIKNTTQLKPVSISTRKQALEAMIADRSVGLKIVYSEIRIEKIPTVTHYMNMARAQWEDTYAKCERII